jgi:tetratricopeptide (TPR) repeat protein
MSAVASRLGARPQLKLNSNNANVIVASSRLLAYRGHLEEAIDRIREAMRLNPYHPDWYWVNLGPVLCEAGIYAGAAEAFGRVTGVGYWVHCRLADYYAQLGGRMRPRRKWPERFVFGRISRWPSCGYASASPP